VTERRIVVTGLGAVSAFGVGVPSLWDGLSAGHSAIRAIATPLPTPLRFSNGAEVLNFQPTDHFAEKQLSLIDRFAQYGLVAAREAIAQSRVVVAGPRTAIVTGCSAGGQDSMDDGFLDLYGKSLPRVSPMMIPRVMSSGAASWIAMEQNITGPAFSISTACSSSNHAIGQALFLLRSGIVDIAVTGGAEAVFSYGFLRAWEAMRVVSTDTCRPFSRHRKGLILGEGAGMLVLETLETARERGADILGEIVGFGMSSDAHHITQPSSRGPAQAMSTALQDAAIAPDDVGYINAHGTGTLTNDAVETGAILEVFGRHAEKLLVSSTKSMHGHALGAAGALEAVATLLALRFGVVPPTANYAEHDPDCDLDVVPNKPRNAQVEYALSNSFAFGGLNAVLAFRRYNAN
jgi:nodulation protein E